MKKTILRLTVSVLTLVVGIMFGVSDVALAYSEKKPMVIKCGISSPPTEDEARTVTLLGKVVQKRTKGRLKFQFFYGASLIKKPQLVEGVARGIADISIGPISFVTGKIPAASIFEVYGCYNLGRWTEVEKAINPVLVRMFAKHGIHHVGVFYAGPALFPHKKKFLKSPAEWKGQKMRLGGRWQSGLGKKWGASPVFMPPPDLYLALQRGVIEGFMLPWHLVHAFKLYEVTPYITHTGFSNNLGIITMNLKKWNALTEADQAIFNKTADEVLAWAYMEMMSSHDRERGDILSKGGKVYDLTPAERSVYLKSSYEMWPEVRKVSGPIGNELCDILEKFREK
ncbi:MAG: TRAP transporter substrate-binding protein DctP [Deltaproteobacteria bacterium]|nr:TRAP transporter substrate-binding protein DctP [Deltaproteobacteria bacterium]